MIGIEVLVAVISPDRICGFGTCRVKNDDVVGAGKFGQDLAVRDEPSACPQVTNAGQGTVPFRDRRSGGKVRSKDCGQCRNVTDQYGSRSGGKSEWNESRSRFVPLFCRAS